MKQLLSSLLLLLLILCQLPAFSQEKLPRNMQDVLYLYNGWIIRGEIILTTPDSLISIETEGHNVFVFHQNEVRSRTIEARKLKARRKYEPIPLKAGYYGTFQVATLFGMGRYGYAESAGSLTTSHGYRLNHWLSLGGGTGMYFYDPMIVAPVFGEVRSVFREEGASFFGYVRGGYGWPMTNRNADGWGIIESEVKAGWHTEYAVGIRLPTKRKFAWTIGVNSIQQQASEYYEYEWEETIDRTYVFRRMGLFIGWELN